MRILNLNHRPRYDAVREMRAFRTWAATLDFPDGPLPGKGYDYFKIPLPQHLLAPPRARRAIVSRAAQVLVDAAARLAGLKPARHRNARVTAGLDRSDPFQSDICVFFEEDAFRKFVDRDSGWERWTPIGDESLARDWGLSIPAGFSEAGFRTWREDDDGDGWREVVGEYWLIGDVDR